MGTVSPQLAADLAKSVYLIQSNVAAVLEDFLDRPEFSNKSGHASRLKAEVGFRVINAKDGFGMCVRGGIGYENDLFIMFRGTTGSNYGADIISDLRIGVGRSKVGSSVHIGFNHAFCSMTTAIDEFLGKHGDATGTVHVIGHSLGGAVAALAAEWLGAKGKQVKLYTFGAPKPGLECFADHLTNRLGAHNIYRVYHTADVVPMVPVYPFAHSPTWDFAYSLPSRAFISLAAHKMVNYAHSVKDANWLMLKKTGEQTADAQSIQRWLKSDKPINPADPKTWDWINAGLAWVLRKVIGGAAIYLQSPFMSVFSLADKMAWLLIKGIDLSVEASGWVLNLMRKIMQALGHTVVKTATELTQHLMRWVLQQLIRKMSAEAERAIRGLTQTS